MTRITPVLLAVLLLPQAALAQASAVDLYGFFTMEAEVNNKDAAGKRWTFDIHHFNVITVYHLDDHFRVFGEIEWDHGTALASDSGSGQVALERGWLEYKHSDAFKIKLGKYLAPFGIYNLRHDASPTFLSTFLPSSVYGRHENTVGGEQRLYAKFATGVQVLGRIFRGGWQGQYYLYLSNGRGPDPGGKDNNSNKGLGARLVVSPPAMNLRLAISYYEDRNGNANDTKQRVVGFDATLRRSSAQLEAELVLPWLEQVDAAGVPDGSFRSVRGYYLQGAYTFFDRLTPFARYDHFDPDVDGDGDAETHVVLGINLSITPTVYAKNEVHLISFDDPARASYELYVASLAVAF